MGTTRPSGGMHCGWLAIAPVLALALLLPALAVHAGPPSIPALGITPTPTFTATTTPTLTPTPSPKQLPVDPVIVRVAAYLPESGEQHELWPLLLLFGLVAIGSGLWRRRIARHVDQTGHDGM